MLFHSVYNIGLYLHIVKDYFTICNYNEFNKMGVDKMLICDDNFIGKMNSELGDIVRLIKAELREKGWSQAKLAGALGRSGGWLSHIMHDKRRLTVQTLIDIAHILNINITLPISKDSENAVSSKAGLEDYIENIVDKRTDEKTRMIIQEELSKYKKGG